MGGALSLGRDLLVEVDIPLITPSSGLGLAAAAVAQGVTRYLRPYAESDPVDVAVDGRPGQRWRLRLRDGTDISLPLGVALGVDQGDIRISAPRPIARRCAGMVKPDRAVDEGFVVHVWYRCRPGREQRIPIPGVGVGVLRAV